ncbi:MAG: energy transducer TonB [Flavobacteriaceae bacterium]|nr:MAG: energy transducer TonB [Flavobacteriaceae bacterium]
MKPKKNPNKDLNKNRGLYFISGLVLIMLLAYTALEWKTYDSTSIYDIGMDIPDEITEEAPPIIEFKIPPPPPPPVAPPFIEVAPDKADIIETEILSTETNQEEKVLKVEEVKEVEILEDINVPISVVEEVPIFPGCENASDKLACFQKMITKHVNRNIRYPEIAQELGIEGRVSVVFVIQKDGSIGNIQLKGPDKSLEKEAARIIAKLPIMEPGKQQKNPVKVPFSIPINFKLQQ